MKEWLNDSFPNGSIGFLAAYEKLLEEGKRKEAAYIGGWKLAYELFEYNDRPGSPENNSWPEEESPYFIMGYYDGKRDLELEDE